MTAKPLPLWAAIALPTLLWIAQIWLEVVTPPHMKAALYSEGGPHETVQFIFMVASFVLAAFLFLRLLRTSQPAWLRVWVGMAMLACLYVAGEEVSWGQHLFNWTTPNGWAHLNDQNETNLHNVSHWLDQKPRLILEIGIIVGGLIIPLLRRLRPKMLPQKFNIIYPEDRLMLTAFFAELAKWGDAFAKTAFHHPLFERGSEVQELYFFLFVLLYLVMLRRRIIAGNQGSLHTTA